MTDSKEERQLIEQLRRSLSSQLTPSLSLDPTASDPNTHEWRKHLYLKLVDHKGRSGHPPFEDHLLRSWRLTHHDVTFNHLGGGLWQARFTYEAHLLRVIELSPWHLTGSLVAMERARSLAQPRDYAFATADFWVRFLDIPPELQRRETVAGLAGKVGDLLEVTGWEGSGRARVRVRLHNPLVALVLLQVGDVELRVPVSYEKLPSNFCAFCGLIGHKFGDCEEVLRLSAGIERVADVGEKAALKELLKPKYHASVRFAGSVEEDKKKHERRKAKVPPVSFQGKDSNRILPLMGSTEMVPEESKSGACACKPSILVERISVEEEANDGNEVLYDEVCESFHSMGLSENLLRGINAYGLEKPCLIQQRGIIPFCKGFNVILEAQSSTGKTLTFCVGVLQQLDYSMVECQALVIAPNKALAQNIEKVTRALGRYLGVKVHSCVGGTSVHEDKRIISSGIHVIVGTPGRVMDMLRRKSLRLNHIKMFVLDEAEEMLSMDFKIQILDIYKLLPSKLQVGIFASTVNAEVDEFARNFTNESVRIIVKSRATDGIRQFYLNAGKEKRKLEILLDLYSVLSVTRSVIFANTRKKVNFLAEQLRSRNYTVSATHDGKQNTSIEEFLQGSSPILIATDVRGLDIQVPLVINYDLPQPERYHQHIISLGGNGMAINLVTDEDEKKLLDIQKRSSVVIEQMPLQVAALFE